VEALYCSAGDRVVADGANDLQNFALKKSDAAELRSQVDHDGGKESSFHRTLGKNHTLGTIKQKKKIICPRIPNI
jgi:hypothetical protein